MIDIASIFKDRTLDSVKLISYGFLEEKDGYFKEFPIMQGTYKAVIHIPYDGIADFNVYDSENGEEYLPAHVYNASGSVVGEMHKSCEEVLKDIAEKCYISENAQSKQAKRIIKHIEEEYGAEPEYLWSRFPDCAAMRVPGKKSWFALTVQIPKNKVGADSDEITDVINLKDEPDKVQEYIEKGMAFPAYHMNKKH